MLYEITLTTLVGIHLMAVATPGPDLMLVVRNGLVQGRKNALLTALGITLGNSIHIGVAAFFSLYLLNRGQEILFYIKLIGALYLVYMGIKCLKKWKNNVNLNQGNLSSEGRDQGFFQGFFTCITNVKALMYFVSIVPQFFIQSMEGIKVIMGPILILSISLFWFGGVGLFSSSGRIKLFAGKSILYLEKFMGLVLIGFGLVIIIGK